MSCADEVIRAMRERPLDFQMGEHTFTDTKTNIVYWTGNGLFFYGVYKPSDFGFDFIGKIKFSFALKEWRANWTALKHREVMEKTA